MHTNPEASRMQSSVRSLQSALSSIAADIERIGASGGTAGLQQAKARLDDLRDQVGDLVSDQLERAEEMGETVRKSVADNPFTAIAAAFAAGIAAALLLSRR